MSFKKRVNGSWVDTPNYIHNTLTDTITTLPADIYSTGTTATVGLKGNMEQNGTPTPTTPIQPQETGDLETVGVKAGQYKIPISSANTTTPIYLGEVETTRKIKKLVLTGDEQWRFFHDDLGLWQFYISNISLGGVPISSCMSNIAPYGVTVDTRRQYNYGCYLISDGDGVAFQMKGDKDTLIDTTSWKSYLAAKYAAGTPVTVWYILATPTTGIVNEPLRKIGDYADEVSGITIPTIAGANTISIGTTLEPSEVSINYKGWHPVTDVHRFNGTSWN